MQPIGFKLLRDSDNAVMKEWGGTVGHLPDVPNPITLPNGDHVCGLQVGSGVFGYTLVSWMMDDPGPPPHTETLEKCLPSSELTPMKTIVSYQIVRRTLDEQKQAVKNEAQRRILAITGKPDILSSHSKQLNALMRASEITNKLALTGSITPEEVAESEILRGLATSIKAIREKSDVIEAMSPIPLDFSQDSYWT